MAASSRAFASKKARASGRRVLPSAVSRRPAPEYVEIRTPGSATARLQQASAFSEWPRPLDWSRPHARLRPASVLAGGRGLGSHGPGLRSDFPNCTERQLLGTPARWVLRLRRPVGTAASIALNLGGLEREDVAILQSAENEQPSNRQALKPQFTQEETGEGTCGVAVGGPADCRGPRTVLTFRVLPVTGCGSEPFWVLNSSLSASPGCCLAGPAGLPVYLGVSTVIMTHCYLVSIVRLLIPVPLEVERSNNLVCCTRSGLPGD